MSFVVVIPARYASTRLPGKPLVDIAGKPMVQHVYERAKMSQADQVVVATDDERIYDASKHFDAWAIMTSESHPSGTDRLEEVAREMDLTDDDVIVNVQGDEPLIPPSLIDQVADNLLAHPEAGIATLCERLYDAESVFNPNVVKVVFDHQGFANYFSRAPIPWSRDTFSSDKEHLPQATEYYRHIGIYAYRVGFLKDYVTWSPSMTEQVESLEQLRALSNGVKIHVELAGEKPQPGVDTQEDLDRIREIMGRQNG